MDPLTTGLLGLGAMFVLIALHIPIGVAMGLTGFVGVGLIIGFGPAASLLGTEPSSAIANEGLAVVALFLLMGSLAGTSGLSSELYRLAAAFLGHRRGGLALATIAGCAGFGAVCGSSVATAATMAKIALPEMRERGYASTIASGAIAAGGTLGMLIPPSVVMILYGVLTETYVIALFAAAILPGLVAVLFHFAAIWLYARLHPANMPAGRRYAWQERRRELAGAWAVVLLTVIVSGGIYSGIATVTEAAALGAGVTLVLALARRRLGWSAFLECLGSTAANTGMIFLIIVGASIFSYFVSLSQLPGELVGWIQSLDLPPTLVIVMLLLMYLVLGSVFDTIAAMVITLPFVFPLVTSMGYDPIWWGVINIMVIEIGLVTPPIGINVFVLHGMAKDLPLATIFRGVLPFLIADLARLAVLVAIPAISLWLPRALGLM